MNFEDIIIPLAVFASLVAVVWLLVSGIVRVMIARTLRETAKASPESLDVIAARLAAPPVKLRGETVGLIGVALGAALAVAGLIGTPEARILLLQAALLPGFIGAALIGQRWMPRAPALPQLPEV